MKTILTRHPMSLKGLKEDTEILKTRFKAKPQKVDIVKIIELTKEKFKDFTNVMYKDQLYIEEHSDLCKWTEELATVLLIKEKGTEDKDGILVETDGATYAMHAGIPIIEIIEEDIEELEETLDKENLEKMDITELQDLKIHLEHQKSIIEQKRF